MNPSTWVDARISGVRVADVRTYLLGRGWRMQPYPGSELLVFEGPEDDDGEPIIQVLPSSEGQQDFRMRLEELITALSIIENRPALHILLDMLASQSPNGAARDQGPDERPVKAE